jgi:hypothetical protein
MRKKPYNTIMTRLKTAVKFKFLLIFLILAALASGVYYYFFVYSRPDYEKAYEKAVSAVATIKSWNQSTQTETKATDRELYVSGIYTIDHRNKNYSSRSTTTLKINEAGAISLHNFSFENISVGKDIYINIKTESERLKSTMQTTEGWYLFDKNSIPENFKNIAISGPVMDSLNIFKKNGKYVKIIKSGDSENLEGKNCFRYELVLNEKAFTKQGDLELGNMADRIGKAGIIELWINKETSEIEQIMIKNPPYYSISRIRDINKTNEIKPPEKYDKSFK